MKIGTVTSDKIHFTRQSRATDAEIKDLAVDIRDNGLKHPILVDSHTGLLLDGLSRVRAYQMLGWSVIPAALFDEPREATDLMEAERENRRWPYQRIMELNSDMKVITEQWDNRRRSVGRRPKKGVRYPKIEGSRLATSRATGVSENTICRIKILMNLAKDGNPEAQHLVDNIFASPPGSPIIGFGRANKLYRLQKTMLPMSDEERAKTLADILRAVETSLDQVWRVGGLHVLPSEAKGALFTQANDIFQAVSKIRKELRRQQGE